MSRKPKTDQLALPPFLARRAGEEPKYGTGTVTKKQTEAAPEVEKKIEYVWLTPLVRLAETAYEEAGFAMKRGVVPRRWRDNQSMIDELHDKLAVEAAKPEKEEKVPRVKKFAGMTKLKDIWEKIKGPKPEFKHAKKAIEAAGIPHTAWRIKNSDVFDLKVGDVIRNYVPQRKQAAADDLPKTSIIRWGGKNPKKEGSDAYERWDKLIKYNGKTVGEFIAAGGNATTLKNAIKRGSAKLTEKKADGDPGEHEHEVPRKDGKRVRGEAKEAASVGSGKRDRPANADVGKPKGRKASGRARRHR